MFYECGWLKGYSYIYDSNDGSCELISENKLKSSGVVVSDGYIGGSIDEPRLKMLYKFEKDMFGIIFDVCHYCVDFGVGTDIHIDLHFRILDTINASRMYNGVSDELDTVCFGNSNKFLFLEVSDLSLNVSGNINSIPNFRCVKYIYDIIGFPVPFQMFVYIMRLAREHNFRGIDDAMCGVLCRNLKLASNIGSKDLGLVNWSV